MTRLSQSGLKEALESMEGVLLQLCYLQNGVYIVKMFLRKLKDTERLALNRVIVSKCDELVSDKTAHQVLKTFIQESFSVKCASFFQEFFSLNLDILAKSAYSNRVVQKYIAHWATPGDKLVSLILDNFVSYATQKYSSSLITSISALNDSDFDDRIEQLVRKPSVVAQLSQNFHGKFILERLNKKHL